MTSSGDLVGSGGSFRLAGWDGLGDGFLVIHDIFESGIQLIKSVFLNNIVDVSQVVRIRAITRRQQARDELHAGFFSDIFMIALIGE